MDVTAPWPFIESAREGDGIPNLPTPEGAELGSHAARFAELEFAKTGRDSRCETCAFRLGTIPNQCGATVANAMKCAIEGEPFGCHETKRPCGGWVALAAHG